MLQHFFRINANAITISSYLEYVVDFWSAANSVLFIEMASKQRSWTFAFYSRTKRRSWLFCFFGESIAFPFIVICISIVCDRSIPYRNVLFCNWMAWFWVLLRRICKCSLSTYHFERWNEYSEVKMKISYHSDAAAMKISSDHVECAMDVFFLCSLFLRIF